ncbi:helix-turn-helix domain-containing protein [Roseospira marina]|nr:helix-turn-helix transcriptional regulator [Roseospira marina]MBB4315366.1 transcriptional regulator with XRE-family HTH domain [Roseospira marina]MBB5088365.1 transcriptional regulator with XRE-family HTH domain [Roseospira marina]
MTDAGLYMTLEARSNVRAGGTYLRHLREGREITRAELAEQLLNVTEPFVADVETGRIRLPGHAMGRWAAALGVRRDALADALGRLYDPLPFDSYWAKAAA